MSIKNFAIMTVLILAAAAVSSAQTQRGWQYYFKRGQLQFKAEMYNYAILSMNKALELNPKLYQAANYLAEIYLIKGKKLQGLEYFETSLAINPGQPDQQNKIGELYEFFEDRDKAFSAFHKAVTLDPNHVLGNCNLARFYIKKKENDTATAYFTHSYMKGKEAAAALMEKARDADTGGDAEGAVALYGKVLEKNPADIESYLRIFELQRSRKDFRGAADILERLVFLKPDHEQAYIKLGHLYFADPLPGKKERHLNYAIKYFKQAIKLNPANGDTYFSLAQVYRFMGKIDEAVKVEKEMEGK